MKDVFLSFMEKADEKLKIVAAGQSNFSESKIWQGRILTLG
jgi:hypothetical protein